MSVIHHPAERRGSRWRGQPDHAWRGRPVRAVAALGVPPLVALLAGVWGLDRGSMWQDEATTYAVAGRSLPELWRTLGHVDAVHGCYYLLVHALLSVTGGLPPEVVLRLPSLLATAGAAAGVAAIGRRLASPLAGLMAGLFYATAPVVGYYAQEARSYALVAAGVVLASLLFVRALARPRRTGGWAWYAGAVAVACLLNLFAALALAAHAVTLVWARAERAAWIRWAAACLCALLAVAPVAGAGFTQRGQVAWLEPPGWTTVSDLVARFAGTGVPLALTAVLVVVAVVAALMVRSGRSERLERHAGLLALALPLAVVPPALLLAVSAWIQPFYQDRYVLYAVAGLALAVGGGIAAAVRPLRWGVLRLGVAGALAALLTVPALPVHERAREVASRPDDPAAVARIIAAGARPGDAVLFLPSVRRLVAEAYPAAFRNVRDVALRRSGAESGTLAGRELGAEQLPGSVGDAPRVWVISRSHPRDADLASPQDTAKRLLLKERYNRRMFTRVLGYSVRLYVRKGLTPSASPRSGPR
ncbi:glycosyltransferase family 39 protein [Microbispora sp. RL4-1S]|uniref:Glycosyltransferase family 39 protein n=1 Tax=Microbispora oryzae TaxID=2806554 RepID=A0A940WH13_9ACTN|nr:glycosyltransferase family 39 protein [Microbispora oryzae]MBP2705544.1 glycosyltransferase family 39 protein [Microbispora oryzae]